MGGRPLEALALAAIGVERLSVTPAAIGPLKAMIRSVDAGAIQTQMDAWLANPNRDLRSQIEEWARAAAIEF